jgi:putative ABC transport system substrate-binding protein
MRRRNVIAMLSVATIGWPLALRAQQKSMPVIGYLDAGSPGLRASLLAALRQG